MSARSTIQFAVFDALVNRGGRVQPHEAEHAAEEITNEILKPEFRWALKELGKEEDDAS